MAGSLVLALLLLLARHLECSSMRQLQHRRIGGVLRKQASGTDIMHNRYAWQRQAWLILAVQLSSDKFRAPPPSPNPVQLWKCLGSSLRSSCKV